MKRMISNIILFVLITAFVCFIYIGMFGISIVTLCTLFIIFIMYGSCIGMALKSANELKKYEKKLISLGLAKQDYLKILYFSLITLSPTYFCLFLVSLVPLYTYEVWFISVFPCIILSCIPVSSVLEEYNGLTRKKIPLLLCFFVCTVAFCLLGVVISRMLFK